MFELAEVDLRHNNRIKPGTDDKARADALDIGIVGKRLTCRLTGGSCLA
tara:strand:+ start:89 stop:235 length:147 start_codon:yes stop_codon:yes gene_type:complete